MQPADGIWAAVWEGGHHRAMKAQQPCAVHHLLEKSGYVGESDQSLGIALHDLEIEMRQQAEAAVAAAHCNNALDIGIGKRAVQFFCPVGVTVCEVSRSRPEFSRETWCKPHLSENRDAVIEPATIGNLPGWTDDGKGVASSKWRWEKCCAVHDWCFFS